MNSCRTDAIWDVYNQQRQHCCSLFFPFASFSFFLTPSLPDDTRPTTATDGCRNDEGQLIRVELAGLPDQCDYRIPLLFRNNPHRNAIRQQDRAACCSLERYSESLRECQIYQGGWRRNPTHDWQWLGRVSPIKSIGAVTLCVNSPVAVLWLFSCE